MSILISLVLMVSPANAQGKKKGDGANPVVSGELPGTAHTLKKGQLKLTGTPNILQSTGALDAVWVSANYGVTPKSELGINLNGLRWGPNLSLEQQLMGDGGQALSLGVSASSDWGFDTQALGAGIMYTNGKPRENRFNLGGGVALATSRVGSDRTNAVGTNLHVGYDFVLKPRDTVQVYANVDPLNSGRSSSFIGTGGGAWTHGVGESFRLRLGLNVAPTAGFEAAWNAKIADSDPVDFPDWAPLPFGQVWFKF